MCGLPLGVRKCRCPSVPSSARAAKLAPTGQRTLQTELDEP